jgi:hypothetical protein
MDRSNKQTNLYTNDTRRSVPVQRNIFRSWLKQPYNYQQGDRGYQCNRHNKYLPAIALCLTSIATAPATLAETVGGVSATAAPIANSSGSVTNQAIQVLQGPYITNTYGGGIQCQGPTVNFTPFVTGSASMQKPYEDYWDSPVYDMTTDDDGNLNNPGDILYTVPTRTGQKDNYNISVGFSATWSTPQDKKLQELCKEAAAANIELMRQQNANKRLDFEIARLKNCGELLKSGIRFAPGTKYARICADVQVRGVNFMVPHVHSIPSPSTSESRGSSDAALLGAPLTTGRGQTSP